MIKVDRLETADCGGVMRDGPRDHGLLIANLALFEPVAEPYHATGA